MLLTATSIALAGCTSGSEQGEADTPTDTGDSGSSDAGGKAQANVRASVKLGELVEGDNLAMVVRDLRTTTKLGQFSEAASGNTFVVVRMAVKNTSDGFVDFSSFWQSRVKDDSNTVYDPSLQSTDHPITTSVLASGEVARGDVVFEVPKDVSDQLSLQFDLSTFDLFQFERITVDLGQRAAEVGDVSQSLDVDVRSSGDTAKHEGVAVTLHGVETRSQVGDFATPEEGNEYVIPDIEISNGTGEPLAVSSLLQMRVKDGTGLGYGSDIAATSQLDKKYSEGSEIAPGDSRRGKIAYQVGTDVSTAFWTFNFMDFDATQKAFWQVKG